MGRDHAGGASPFKLPRDPRPGLRGWWRRTAAGALERATGLKLLDALYLERDLGSDPAIAVERSLQTLGLDYVVTGEPLESVPRDGSLLVVANHAFGGAEGLVLAALLHRVRRDIKILGTPWLSRLPELAELFLPIDPFGHSTAVAPNARALRAALAHLRSGGVLALFPAGEVAHVRGETGALVDPPWQPGVGWLVRRSGAPVLPVRVHGSNGPAFRLAGLVHPFLRTALLPRMLLGQRGRRIHLSLGVTCAHDRLPEGTYAEVATWLRRMTYGIQPAEPVRARPPRRFPSGSTADDLAREVAGLSDDQCLTSSGGVRVLCARAADIPRTLLEIGRLREDAFRAVGEGSGRALDLDEFDGSYWHLFAWRDDRREVIGAYRMGPTDEILRAGGLQGLYTRTLFDYDHRLLSQIDPALELGRSFVRREYQRDYSSLMLLWKGIGRFVARHPRYRRLFGPVSISARYESLSIQLLMAFLSVTCYDRDLGRLIRPKHPPSRQGHGRAPDQPSPHTARSVDEVDALVRRIERDHKGVPVLLRQYLRLNARLLGFSVDQAFGNVLDGLMLVDLLDVDRAILTKYMGRDAAREFLRAHGRLDPLVGRTAS